MIQRAEGYFKGYRDFELFYQTWSSNNFNGTLVLTHGLGEHSDSYNRLVEGLAPLPWKVMAWDMPGHGRSEGRRGVIDNFETYCKHLECFLELVRSENPGKPIILLGHSMGGLVCLKTLLMGGGADLDALVLSSPLLRIAVNVPKWKLMAARFLAKNLPNLTLYNEIPYASVTRDKTVIEEYQRDHLRHDRISAKLYVDMLENMEWVSHQAGEVKLPVLMQQAGQDQVVSREANSLFFSSLKMQDKTLLVYEGYKHEVYNDLDRTRAFSDLKNWLSEHMRKAKGS